MRPLLNRWTTVLGLAVIAWSSGALSALAAEASPASARYTEQDRRIAEELNAEGDLAYRAGQFDKARRAYMDSYPNFPNAYAYLMSGDAYWRAVLVAALHEPEGAEVGRCRVSNEHFPSDLNSSLEQHFQRGLSLGSARGSTGKPSAALRQRATLIATCLRKLAKHHASQTASSCVALDRLSACLGAPLLE